MSRSHQGLKNQLGQTVIATGTVTFLSCYYNHSCTGNFASSGEKFIVTIGRRIHSAKIDGDLIDCVGI